MNLSPEKLNIIAHDGNVLVTANPGTGKTLLLAGKFVDLLKKGYLVEDILCLTFTNKARKEMENRILKLIKEENLVVDSSKLNIFTFHSYALNSIDDSDVVSSNLIRYTIYDYLRTHEVLNYGDSYLLEEIVPKIENLMRYLKNFGIMPSDISIEKVKELIGEDEALDKADLERFLVHFVKIFFEYERVKAHKGQDYTDMLLKFLQLKKMPHYKFVLVDELQDLNSIEADIALKSADNFLVVGDAKQAIFGFQGGSILNFKKFSNSKTFILSDNFRSTNEILEYSREYFSSKTKNEVHKEELKNLKNNEVEPGDKVKIVSVDKKDQILKIYALIKQLAIKGGKIAVIVRTNYQLQKISKEFKNMGLDHSSTFFSASDEAKQNIITFLSGVFSKDINVVKNSMFTPFFPMVLQEAFEVVKDKKITLESLYSKCPEYKKLRESVKTVEDVNNLFSERILPVAMSYGEAYMLASLKVQEAWNEALNYVENKTADKILIYLQSSDLLSEDSGFEKNITLINTHKAKGKEYDNVIYVPSIPKNKENFVDVIVEAILKSKGIDAKEELEEETLRVNFVAMTRAQQRLYILTDKPINYINDYSESEEVNDEDYPDSEISSELKKRAFTLFVNGEFEKAKKALENRDEWLISFIENHFKNLENISFSRLKKDAYEYFQDNILKIQGTSSALSLGTKVHDIAEQLTLGNKVEIDEECAPYVENVKKILAELKEAGYELKAAELPIEIALSQMITTADDIIFAGKIDAILTKDDEYLIIDWKTSKKEDGAGYRQQLEVYRRAYSIKFKVPLEKIKVAIAYIGLRKTINDGEVESSFDDAQPAKSAFTTMTKKLEKFLEWKKDTKVYIEELLDTNEDDPLIRSVKEQLEKEKN